MIILKWVVFVLKSPMSPMQACESALVEAAHAVLIAAESAIDLFKRLHGSGLWPEACNEGKLIHRAAKSTLWNYAKAASSCYQCRVTLFGIVPKFHSFHHMVVDLKSQLGNLCVENPHAYSCEPEAKICL